MNEVVDSMRLMFTRFATQFLLFDSVMLLVLKGKDAKFYAAEVLTIIAISAVCAVLYVLLLSDWRVSKKKMFLLCLSYLFFVNIIVVAAGYFFKWFSFNKIQGFLIFESVVITLSLVTIFYSYKNNSRLAKKMTEKLKSLEKDEE